MAEGSDRVRAIVLSAGLGTRLAPLTDEIPKPLVPIGDAPQIDHVIARLARAGIARVVVNTHHLASAFDDAWVRRQPVEVRTTVEPEILGTAGGIANAREALGDDGDVLVWNGDIHADVDVGALLGCHAAAHALATLVTIPMDPPGNLRLDASGNVVGMRDLDVAPAETHAGYAGIAVLSRGLVDAFPARGCLFADVTMPALRGGGRFAAFPHRGRFHDVGSLGAYLAVNVDWLGARPAFVAPDAEVAPGVTLDRVVVGAGARVAGNGALSDVVVLPGATAIAPLQRAIVTPRRVVMVP